MELVDLASRARRVGLLLGGLQPLGLAAQPDVALFDARHGYALLDPSIAVALQLDPVDNGLHLRVDTTVRTSPTALEEAWRYGESCSDDSRTYEVFIGLEGYVVLPPCSRLEALSGA